MESSNDTLGNDNAGSNDAAIASQNYVPRASHACETCRLKKTRCDQQNPCSFCQKHSINCVYSSQTNGQLFSKYSQDRRFRRASRVRKDGRGTKSTSIRQSDVNSDLRGHQRGYWNGSETTMVEPSPQTSDEPRGQQPTDVDSQQHEESHAEGALEPELDPDIVGDINRHTSGTEFYGMSSNFVLLNQLFSRARLHASDADLEIVSSLGITQSSPTTANGHTSSLSTPDPLAGHLRVEPSTGPSTVSSHLSAGRLSIINLLYNEEAMLPPSRPKTPVASSTNEHILLNTNEGSASSSRGTNYIIKNPQNISNSRSRRGQRGPDSTNSNFFHPAGQNKNPAAIKQSSGNTRQSAEERLEKEFVRIFFNNLHHLHPFLLVDEFTSRCEDEIWNRSPNVEPQWDLKHFLSLYNIVIAVGALIAGEITLLVSESTHPATEERDGKSSASSVTLSVTYFRKSKALLGDVFEVCSLESAQTLFLMSLYCQNALKPHSCYMYSGMAVRTALAIGLPSESMSKSTVARRVARRTWWCIYSHEIDMCCSSGRLDSLRKPGSYLIPLPRIEGEQRASSEDEGRNISMINEMVNFAIVLRQTSKEIYHDSKGLTLFEKASRALELDMELRNWRQRLPQWLNLDSVSFREPEWASKQKLVLQLRYLNARILLHRPFLASVASQNVARLEENIEPCLESARKTIELMYEAYAHRYYFRTWWYNSTYTLYAGMIILYIVLLNYDKIPGEELILDVEKSHEILLSMEQASVAQRSAALMLEVIEVTKAYLARRRRFMQLPSVHSHPTQFGTGYSESLHNGLANVSMDLSNDWQRTLFAEDFLGLSRVDMLSTLIDPNILDDFAAENNYFLQNDFL